MAWRDMEFMDGQDPQGGFFGPSLHDSRHTSTTGFHIATADYTDPWSIEPSVANPRMYQNLAPNSYQASSPNPTSPLLVLHSPSPLRPNSSTLSNPSLYPVSSNSLGPSFHPGLPLLSNANRGPLNGDRTATRQRRVPEKRILRCPWREKEIAQGADEFSCRGCSVATMGGVRRHAKRAHAPSIQLCPTCKRHVFDEEVFKAEHGDNGRRCVEPRAQARDTEAIQGRWWELYHMIDVRVPTQMAGSVSHSAISNSVDTATVIPSSGEDPGTLQLYTTREHFHNPYDDVYQEHLNKSPNFPTKPGDNSKLVFIFDEQLTEATSACELGSDTPLSSTPTRPQHEITLRSNELVTFPALQDPPMISKTVSLAPPSVQGSGKANCPNERQVETANTSVDNTENSAKSLSAPESVTEQSSSCDICGVRFLGGYSRGNLSRHKRLKHGLEPSYPCSVVGCPKTYRRQDARLKHYRHKHPELEVEDPRRK